MPLRPFDKIYCGDNLMLRVIFVGIEGMLFCIVAPFQNAISKYFFIIIGMALII
jgi:hypothetical protein